MDLGVNLTIGKLLVSIPAVEKQVTKTIFKDKAVQFRINSLSSAKGLEATIPYAWYSMDSPKVKICLKNSFKITALLDTDAEINVIIRKVIEDTNLAMR